jgi:very-short-patch-repair endonuclease
MCKDKCKKVICKDKCKKVICKESCKDGDNLCWVCMEVVVDGCLELLRVSKVEERERCEMLGVEVRRAKYDMNGDGNIIKMYKPKSFENSFASHVKALYWSEENNIGPESVYKNSGNKYKFNCKCGHTFINTLACIAHSGQWCSYCANKSLCNNNECDMCLQKSFASHVKALYWSKENNEITPRDVFKNTHTKYYFDCDICKHTFDIRLNDVMYDKWCSYCNGDKMCDKESCIFCFNKSFASHPRESCWSDKNIGIKPRDVTKFSHSKYYFNCDVCDKLYYAKLNSIAYGMWCSCNIYKTEKILHEYLEKEYYFTKIKRGQKFDWCKNINHLPFDFCIEEYKIIIELDGDQHFKQVLKWASPEQTQKNDKYKMECAINNGYFIIRLLQQDVFNNKNDWKNKLNEAILRIIECGQIIIYIGDIYSKFEAYSSMKNTITI